MMERAQPGTRNLGCRGGTQDGCSRSRHPPAVARMWTWGVVDHGAGPGVKDGEQARVGTQMIGACGELRQSLCVEGRGPALLDVAHSVEVRRAVGRSGPDL